MNRCSSALILGAVALCACTATAPLQSEPPYGTGDRPRDEPEGGNAGGGHGGTSGVGSIAGAGGMTGGAAGDAAPSGTGGVGGSGAVGGMVEQPTAGTGGFAGTQSGEGGESAQGGEGGEGGEGGGPIPDPPWPCDAAAAYEPLVARPDEVCYELQAHDGDGVSPFQVPTEESYNQFYYDIPWPDGTVATRFGMDFDSIQVMHHWLAFVTEQGTPGEVVPSTLTAIGDNAELFAGWAVGGCNIEMPPDVGLELADPGTRKLMIQWHHYNFTGVAQPDASRIQICTVPRDSRSNIASLTMLGTETLDSNGPPGSGMPPGMESVFSGTCLNETSAPITIIALWPHMHEIGTHMLSEIEQADGSAETVFDRPFQFDYQVHYELSPHLVLQPGERIRSECTYFNNTAQNVGYGPSAKQEVCYQLAFSYPAGALDKPGNPSLIGATNTCWGD